MVLYEETTRSGGSDPLTKAISGSLALVAAVGWIAAFGYAIWWLIVYWAPFRRWLRSVWHDRGPGRSRSCLSRVGCRRIVVLP